MDELAVLSIARGRAQKDALIKMLFPLLGNVRQLTARVDSRNLSRPRKDRRAAIRQGGHEALARLIADAVPASKAAKKMEAAFNA